MQTTRRQFLKTSALGAAGTLATPYFFHRAALAADTIDVGVLFSLTGGLSIIEKSLSDATLMAIAVINAKGPTVFGSYTSASRKAVLPVFEKRNNMYFYPTYYEGYECSKNVVYTGAVPN